MQADAILCKGHADNHFIKALAKEFKPVQVVPWHFCCFAALFEFHLIENTTLSVKIIGTITNPAVRIVNEYALVEIMVFLWQEGQNTFNKRRVHVCVLKPILYPLLPGLMDCRVLHWRSL